MDNEKSIFSVRDLPKSERPREKLRDKGVANISNSELLAIIIGKGVKGESVLVTVQKLILHFGGLQNILEASLDDLMKIRGIGFAKACQLIASFELSKRLLKENIEFEKERVKKNAITKPEEIVKYIKTEIEDYSKEHFFVVSFDVRNRVIGIDKTSKGTLSASLVHPRETFESAIRRHAAQIIVAHNHPSGDTEPSEDDIRITKRLYEAGKIMGIELLDHIIITKDGYCSLKDKNIF
ncbi:MAG: DNA repair protein RadC [Ignavibacteriae bacterium]|nr:DNA repair protein RadC [Ignavibacteriota bacterium]